MRKLYIIILLLFSITSMAQKSTVQRAGAANVVEDQNLRVGQNFYLPTWQDTTAANVSLLSTQDTLGAIIFTYDVNNFWVRVGNPKHWQQGSGGGVTLPDGVYSGGQVVYSGTGYSYIVTAATYVLRGQIYQSQQDTVTLDPADPTFNRVDVIGLTTYIGGGTAGVIAGTPSANPQEPSVDPLSFIRRSTVTVVANTTQPPYIDQSIIYDEGTGEPTEWTASSDGNTNFLDISNPYHLTIDAKTTTMGSLQRVRFINNDTINSASRSTLIIPIYLASVLNPSNNFYVQLLYQGNPVSQLLPFTKYGMLNNVTGSYQITAFPFPEFGPNNIVFDEVDVVLIGGVVFPTYYLDYIQMQSGISYITQIPDQRFGLSTGDNFANENRQFNQNNKLFNIINSKFGINTNAPQVNGINIGASDNGSTNIAIGSGSGLNSFIQTYGVSSLSLNSASFLEFTPGYGVSSNGGWRMQGRNTNYMETIYGAQGLSSQLGRIGTDSYGGASQFFIAPIQTISSTYLNLYGPIKMTGIPATSIPDSIISQKGDTLTKTPFTAFLTTFYNSNVGSSFRWAIPNSNQIKTLRTLNGILADSSTSNTLSIQVDSSQYATKAYVQSVAGGGGFTGVTSVSATDANGFDFTVTNPTTTPAISLTTTVPHTQLIYSNSGGVAGSSNLVWDNTNQRLNIGGGSAVAYLGLHAGTTAQAPINLAPGVPPASPVNGDFWTTSTDAFIRLNGSTIQITNPAAAGVTSITGTANQVNASASTGAVTLSLPQSIATTSTPTFRSLTLGGTAATTPLTFTSNTDATGSAGRWYYNGTRLGFSPSTTIKRVILSNDVTPTSGQILIGNGTDFNVGTISAANNSLLAAVSASTVTFRTNSIVQSLSGTSVTLNANNGENGNWTLSAAGSSLTISNPVAGRTYFINVVQDGTGNRTITTYPAGTVWYSGTAPVLKTTAGAVNTLAFYYNGSNYYGYDWGSGAGGGFSNPMTTLGDIIYGSTGGAASRLAGNITTTQQVLTQTGTGAVSAVPIWTNALISYSSTNVIDFPNTGAQTSSEISVAIANAAVGDRIIVGSTVNPANSMWSGSCQVAGQVAVRFCNFSATAINPASGTFKIYVLK